MDDASLHALLSIGSGALIGCTLGLIGGGGSILATPLLVYCVGIRDVHVAIGTGALAVAVNAYLNLIGHAIRGHVWWRCALIFTAVGAFGAYLGSTLGKIMDGERLLVLFGLLMMFVSFAMRRCSCRSEATPQSLTIGAHRKTGIVALLTGMGSGFFGIGGGFLIVPGLLLSTRMPVINAIGTSLLAVGTFGLTTALNYAASGLVDWRTAGFFIAGGVGGGVLGTMAASRLSYRRNLLSQIFSWIVFCVSICILWRGWTRG